MRPLKLTISAFGAYADAVTQIGKKRRIYIMYFI